MGNTTSSRDNDFELVIRVSKDLDHALKTEFGRSETSLTKKINEVEKRQDISRKAIQHMKTIVQLRNELLHKFDKTHLSTSEANSFGLAFMSVVDELNFIPHVFYEYRNSFNSFHENDFELVIKVCKELDHMLETKFGRFEGNLREKIEAIKNCRDCYNIHVSSETIANMRSLVQLRNELVHDYDKNDLLDSERNSFLEAFKSVKRALDALSPISVIVEKGTERDEPNQARALSSSAAAVIGISVLGLLAGAAVMALSNSSATSDNEEEKKKRARRQQYA